MRGVSLGLIVMLVVGCADREPTPADNAGATDTSTTGDPAGSTTATEPSTTGAMDTTGALGCGPDDACLEMPEGFLGPIAIARTNSGDPPVACQGRYAELLFELGTNPSGGDHGCTCECAGPSPEAACEPPTLYAYDPEIGCDFPVLTAWDRLEVCRDLGTEPPLGAIYGVAPTEYGPDCAANVVAESLPPAEFETRWTVCLAPQPGACEDGTCLPSPPAGFDELLCIYSAEDGATCDPDGPFPSWQTGYANIEDTRTCDGACDCGLSGTCTWSAELSTACGEPGLAVETCTEDLDVTGITHAVINGPEIENVQCTADADVALPQGGLEATEPVTLCCQLPE